MACTIGGGLSNQISARLPSLTVGATIAGGENNVVTANYGTVSGGRGAAARNYGQMAHASGPFSTSGDAQTSTFVCRGVTTGATAAELFLDGLSRRMVVPTNSTWGFNALVTGRASGGSSGAYEIRGTIENTAGTTSLVGSPTVLPMGNDDMTWGISVAADNANQALTLSVFGAANTSIRWVASVRTVEVSY
jgi:hypothetical protein